MLILKWNKIIVLLLIFIGASASGYGQSERADEPTVFWKNVRFGGGIGLGFGDGFFSAAISPSAVYDFSEHVSAGIGLTGIYSSRKNLYNSTVFGGSLIALFNPLPEIQLSTEFEELHVNRNFNNTFVSNSDDNYWYPALFIGAGYRTWHVNFGVRYDVLYDDEKSIYAEPWMPFVRFYF